MKLVCEGDALKAAVRRVRAVVPNRHTLPACTTIRLTLDGETLELAGTDLDMAITTGIPAIVSEAGACCVDAKLLAGSLDALEDGAQVEFTMKPGENAGGKARIKHSGMTVQAYTFDADMWPVINPDGDTWSLSLSGAELARALGLKGFWDTRDDRPYITGIYWHGIENHLVTVATNGHIVGIVDTDVPWPETGADGDPESSGILIFRDTAEKIAHVFGDRAEVEVGWNARTISVRSGPTEIVSKLIDQKPADYAAIERQIDNDKAEASTIISGAELGSAARHLLPMTEGKHSTVRITANKASLVFSIVDKEIGTEAQRTVRAKVEKWPKDAAFSFNGKYLSTVAGLFATREVRMVIPGPGDPCRVEPVGENPGDARAIIVALRG